VGITAQQIEDALNDAYGTKQISTIYATSNEYQVILEVQPEYQQDPSALGRLYIHATAGPTAVSPAAQLQSAPVLSTPAIVTSSQQPAGSAALSVNAEPPDSAQHRRDLVAQRRAFAGQPPQPTSFGDNLF